MKLKFLLLVFITPIFNNGFAQDNNIAFAITGQENANFNWTDIRTIDMSTGNNVSTLFESGKTRFSFLDVTTMKPAQLNVSFTPQALINNNIPVSVSNVSNNLANSPTSLMSAATAYDKRHDKLFFASMRTGQLMWLDLRSGKEMPSFFTLQKTLVNNVDFNDESFNITRMTIGADGNGYALTNDGNHLVRFTTGTKTIITDMGSLIDANSNNGISVHNKCSSWGGDIVADAFGKLYLFCASRNVFIIDPETMVATYIGSVSNLSGTFTVNGAAVIDDNNVLISSANTFEGYYKVDINQLSATKVVTQGKIYNASDLASCNLLHQSEKLSSIGVPVLNKVDVIGNRFISVFPNPVSNGQIKVTFDGYNASGKYKIAITDLQGRFVDTKDAYIKGQGQVETFQFHRKQAAGVYMINVTDATGKSIFTDKLLVE
jgi:Secretion system C-terminal sorting domain